MTERPEERDSLALIEERVDVALVAAVREPPGTKHDFTGDPAGGDHRVGRYAGKWPCWCVRRTDAIESLQADLRTLINEVKDQREENAEGRELLRQGQVLLDSAKARREQLKSRIKQTEEALREIERVIGVGAPDIIVANTMLGRVKQLVRKALG